MKTNTKFQEIKLDLPFSFCFNINNMSCELGKPTICQLTFLLFGFNSNNWSIAEEEDVKGLLPFSSSDWKTTSMTRCHSVLFIFCINKTWIHDYQERYCYPSWNNQTNWNKDLQASWQHYLLLLVFLCQLRISKDVLFKQKVYFTYFNKTRMKSQATIKLHATQV